MSTLNIFNFQFGEWRVLIHDIKYHVRTCCKTGYAIYLFWGNYPNTPRWMITHTSSRIPGSIQSLKEIEKDLVNYNLDQASQAMVLVDDYLIRLSNLNIFA